MGGWISPAILGLSWLIASSARAQAPPQAVDGLPERVRCSIIAAVKFEVPTNVMLAVAEVEGGKPFEWVRNRNGSYDVGPMQFNSAYLAQLQETYGIRAEHVAQPGCYPYELAAWRLRKHLQEDQGSMWQRVANYHSRTPDKNRKYRLRVMRKAQTWGAWLKERFATVPVSQADETALVTTAPAAAQPPTTEAGGRVVAALTPVSHAEQVGQRAAGEGPPVMRLPPVQVVAAVGSAETGSRGKRTPKAQRAQKKPGRDEQDAERHGEQGIGAEEEALLGLVEQSSFDPSGYAAQTWDSASESIGTPHRGRLVRGIQLIEHPGYRVRREKRAYVTAETAAWLSDGFDALLRADPAAPALLVLDASAEGGGRLSGHRSHQSGRDVDMAYFKRGCRRLCRPKKLSAHSLDGERQWRLLGHFLENRQVEFVFVDYVLQGPLYRAAQAAGATAGELRRWFQYPRGKHFPGGLIRHVPNHQDHVHVRFVCPVGDPQCKATRLRARPAAGRPLLTGEDGRGGELWELIDAETEQADEALLGLLPDASPSP